MRPASANTLFVFGVGAGRTTVAAMDATASARPVRSHRAPVRLRRRRGRSRDRAADAGQPHRRGAAGQGPAAHRPRATAGEAARAVSIARGFLGDAQAVENQIAVGAPGADRAARAHRRDVAHRHPRPRHQLAGARRVGSIGTCAARRSHRQRRCSVDRAGATPANAVLTQGSRGFNAMIDALAEDNLVRILAEPNLTVMSGETASFLAGGEFPIPVAGAATTPITHRLQAVRHVADLRADRAGGRADQPARQPRGQPADHRRRGADAGRQHLDHGSRR